MVCDICGSEGARIRRITRTSGKGKSLGSSVLVVDNPSFGGWYSLQSGV